MTMIFVIGAMLFTANPLMHVSKNNNYTNTTTKSWWMYVIITSYSSGSHLQYRTEDEMGCLLNMTKMFASIGQIRRRFL
jgi:hypothetical protein